MTSATMPAFVYVVAEEASPYLKIGVATNIEKRLAGLQVGNPRKLYIRELIEVGSKGQAHRLESRIHEQLAESGVSGEWFRPSDGISVAITRAISALYDEQAGRRP